MYAALDEWGQIARDAGVTSVPVGDVAWCVEGAEWGRRVIIGGEDAPARRDAGEGPLEEKGGGKGVWGLGEGESGCAEG